jgi:DNA-binding NarL/FixJ family response regulator
MSISPKHVNKVLEKLGVRDRVELALYAVRAGIIGTHERASE